jgi:hypothetical protein
MSDVTIIHWIVGLLGAVSVLAVLSSAVRTVMLPRALPALIARVAFLSARGVLRAAARRSSSRRREELLSLQGPIGLITQLITWLALTAVGFAAVLWAADGRPATLPGVGSALRESGSSLTTLGLARPYRLAGEAVSYVEAAVGLVFLALVITYLPTIYGAFSRREVLVSRLSVRAGSPPTATGLLSESWRLGRFDLLEEVWNSYEDWFLDLGETHTSFPQLSFFRSIRSSTSWVTAAGAVLDAAALIDAGVGPARNSRAQLCLGAGIDAMSRLASYFGAPVHRAPDHGADWPRLPRETVATALTELADIGVPLRCDEEQVWRHFAHWRVRYEWQLLTMAALADAVSTPWLMQAHFPQHRPPLRVVRHVADSERD